uniref:Putative integron gene cassette protein n=1 Tax=uncultured microorganism TaxID=358574 RepID=K0J2Z2_9ZZZZ|nr:putative integron gene cassette protein [uncultured microorganism]
MNNRFKKLLDELEPSFQRMKAMKSVDITDLPKDIPSTGIYALFENGKPLYVGRSNRMRSRLQEHCRPSSNHNTAPFAFRLAREHTGNINPTYSSKGSRAMLEKDPAFKKSFDQAKKRVRAMKVKYVSEKDPLRQYLLEIYIALSIKARHNDFDTH